MLNFLMGPLMDEAGDTGGGGAAADTGTESTALTTTTDTSLATVDEPTTELTEESTELTTTEEAPLENGRPSKSTSVALQSIAKTHPQLARQIPRDIAVAARLRAKYPGQNPFDAIATMEKRLKQLGGEEGIASMQAAVRDIEELDALYAKGDPRMLEKMTDTPEGQAAFVKLAPHTLNKWQELAPKSFSKHFARMIVDDLVNQRIGITVQNIAQLTPREVTAADGNKIANPVLAELAKIEAYFQRLTGLEEQAPEVIATPATEKDPLAADRAQIAKDKAEIKAQNWKGTADRGRDELFTKEWKDQTKGLKISAVDQEDILARFQLHLPKALEKIPEFNATLQKFFENDDRDGYLRYLKVKYAETVPRVLRAEIQRRYKPANGTQTQRTEAVTTTAKTPDPGFKRVASQPTANEINVKLTSTEMFRSGKAILKTGARVQWA